MPYARKTDRQYKRWTEKEVEALEKYYGEWDTKRIAKYCNATPLQVMGKAKSMGLGLQREAQDMVSMAEICRMLGVNRSYYRKLIDAGLPVKIKYFGTSQKNIMVQLDELYEWLEQNQDKWDALKVGHLALSWEPEWLKEKRKQERLALENGTCYTIDCYITRNRVLNALGISCYTWYKFVSLGLPYYVDYIGKQTIHKVKIKDLRTFLEKNQNLWDASRLDMCLFGDERPEWLTDKIKRDSEPAHNPDDCVSGCEIMSIMRISRNKFRQWIDCGLPHSVRPAGKLQYFTVKIGDLLTFLEQNPFEWDSTKVDFRWLGADPDWNTEKRQADARLIEQGSTKNLLRELNKQKRKRDKE